MLPTVPIFDNINTFFSEAFTFLKEIAHGFTVLPDLISKGLENVGGVLDIFPPFIQFLILFTASTGIVLKICHYGE